MLLLWFLLILTVKKRWLVMCNRNLHDCIHVFILAPLHFGHLSNWETHQTWSKYGLKIPANFYGPEKTIKLTKKENNKDRRKLKGNCKTLSKVKCIQISYKKCLLWPLIGRVCHREVSSRGECELEPEKNVCYRDIFFRICAIELIKQTYFYFCFYVL